MLNKVKIVELIILTTVFCLLYSILRKIFVKRTKANEQSFVFFIFTTSLITTLIFLLAGIGKPLSRFTFLTALLYGFITFIQHYFLARALTTGYYAVTMSVGSLSTVIPALSGYFWGERFSVWQILGVAFISLFFLLIFFSDKREKLNTKWVLSCVALFFATGGLGVMQKIHQQSAYANQRQTFLLVAFAVSTLLSLLLYIALLIKSKNNITLKKEKEPNKEEKVLIIKENFIFLILLLFSAIGIAGNNQINLYLSGKMLSATFFSFANGLPALLNIFAGTILFKEKLSVRLWIASAFAIIALICLCI